MRYFVILLLSCSFLLADRDGGPYIGVGSGVSKFDDGGLYNELSRERSVSSTFYVGAYINRNLSVEIGYVSFDSWGRAKGYASDNNNTIGAGALSVSTLAHYQFFDEMIDTYARFGVSQMSYSDANDLGFAFVLGCGGSLRLSEMFSVKLAYDMYSFDYDKNGDGTIDKSMQIDYIYSAIEVQF